MKPLRFDDEAVDELDTAAEWYEARRDNLGIDSWVKCALHWPRSRVRPIPGRALQMLVSSS